MNLVNLESFVMVYDYKSFTLAAEISYISQPTLSKRIKQLEEEVDCILFDRSNGSVVPTPAGKLLYKEAQKILNQELIAKEKMRRFRTGIAGTLRLGISPIAPISIVATAISHMSEKYPDVELSIESNGELNIKRLFAERGLDLGVTITGEITEMTGAETEILIENKGIILVGKGHRLFGKTSVTYHDIQGETVIIYNTGCATADPRVLQHIAGKGIRLNRTIYCNSINEYLMYLATGKFIGLNAAVTIEQIHCCPSVIKSIPLVDNTPTFGDFCVFYYEDNYLAKEFAQCLKLASRNNIY